MIDTQMCLEISEERGRGCVHCSLWSWGGGKPCRVPLSVKHDATTVGQPQPRECLGCKCYFDAGSNQMFYLCTEVIQRKPDLRGHKMRTKRSQLWPRWTHHRSPQDQRGMRITQWSLVRTEHQILLSHEGLWSTHFLSPTRERRVRRRLIALCHPEL